MKSLFRDQVRYLQTLLSLYIFLKCISCYIIFRIFKNKLYFWIILDLHKSYKKDGLLGIPVYLFSFLGKHFYIFMVKFVKETDMALLLLTGQGSLFWDLIQGTTGL